jgi:hypothetical protein
MSIKPNRKLVILILAILALTVAVSAGMRQSDSEFNYAWGPLYTAQAPTPDRIDDDLVQIAAKASRRQLVRWNRVSIDASGVDHTPVGPGESRVFGEQLGPGRASRAIAIVHIAMFEALNALDGSFQSYVGLYPATPKTSKDVAISQAAHDALVGVFPSQKARFDAFLAEDLSQVPEGKKKRNGIALGRAAAFSILALTDHDGAQQAEPRVGVDFITSNDPGKWRQDPISLIPLALGAHWGEVTPLVLQSGKQFRAPVPPNMASAAYATAYNEVKRLGGDGITTPTERTADQTQIGLYWAYDGTPSLCAPPRLYNQIAVQIADQMGSNDIELARLLALVNVAMSDAGIAIWESKYFYNLWRPIGGIREADAGTGPTGIGDDNPATTCDPTFMPLGAPASNLTGPNFTPPFPAYPSGHAGFGGALFQILRKFYGTDNIPFSFVSDEFNGVTKDNKGNKRALIPRSFTTLSQAEEENGQSRIYLGIHWSYDKTEGIAQGRKVADWVFAHSFQPAQ